MMAHLEREYYVQYVTNYVSSKYGKELLTGGGLTIYTSMDRTMQQRARASIKTSLAALSGKK